MPKKEVKQEAISIQAPNFQIVVLNIIGTAPYVQHRFSQKARQQIKDKQILGSQAKKGAKKVPRDFDAEYEAAKHVSADGWCGIPASSIRCACVSACRTVGFKMTLAKLALKVLEDGFSDDGTPLIRISGEPEKKEDYVRIQMGTSIVMRPMWREGWTATLRIRLDADILSAADVANLIMRVGAQVGIGEGRPDSKMSCGVGWGTFEIVNENE